MNKVILSAFVIGAGLFASCGGAKKEVKETVQKVEQKTEQVATEVISNPTTIKFAEETFNFGTVNQGEVVTHVYKFTNTGENDLLIADAKGSCGCTVPEWPKAPIAPGAEGEIKVEFKSAGKKGMQNKKVTLFANTQPNQTILTIMGEVIAPEAAAQ